MPCAKHQQTAALDFIQTVNTHTSYVPGSLFCSLLSWGSFDTSGTNCYFCDDNSYINHF